MSKLLPNELAALKATTNEDEWNAVCDAVKLAHCGYPEDWYAVVIMSGVAHAAQLRWLHCL